MALYAVRTLYWIRSTLLTLPLHRPSGIMFTAVPGTTKFVNSFQPNKGDIVSFRHSGYFLQSQKPKNPLLYRLRPELTWQDVCKAWKSQTPRMPGTYVLFSLLLLTEHLCWLGLSRSIPQSSRQPKGYWMEGKNREKFFLNFASKLGFDPNVAENWTKVKATEVVQLEVRIIIVSVPP